VVDPATGVVRPVELFVAALGASNYTYVEATDTQRSADFIQIMFALWPGCCFYDVCKYLASCRSPLTSVARPTATRRCGGRDGTG
jgi:hypothetical protein